MASQGSEFGRKLGIALLGGVVVGGSATLVDLTVIAFTREILVHQMAGNVIAAGVAILFLLAVQLHNEEVHYRFAMERAAMVSELNHHVRNAIFPLLLAVQRTGDAEAQRLSNDAVERINIAMKDAATDVFALRFDYDRESRRPAA